ncbi:unnamed protein product [Amoebophrya sp. A25]|nr:unnamed protein product [Amoebophrya sp. A25]|eukprot:GSA25T00009077001.1
MLICDVNMSDFEESFRYHTSMLIPEFENVSFNLNTSQISSNHIISQPIVDHITHIEA